MQIRLATTNDAKDILNIYKYYILNSAITFEITTPTVKDMENRIEKTLQTYPYLVAVINNKIVGYAYLSPLKEREAFKYCAEISIYVNKDYKGNGIGKKLYLEIEKYALKINIIKLYACISMTENVDQYCDKNSYLYHKHMGYKQIGYFSKCGYKFNNWYDIIWMEKKIGDYKCLEK